MVRLDAEGQYHCLDGPAYAVDGESVWFRHDAVHRLDGPAFELSDAQVEWALRGSAVSGFVVLRAWLDACQPDAPPVVADVLSVFVSHWPSGASFGQLYRELVEFL